MAGTLLAALGGGAAALGAKGVYDGLAGQSPPSPGESVEGVRTLLRAVVDGEISPEQAAQAAGSGVTPKDIVSLATKMVASEMSQSARPAAAPMASVVPQG